MVRDMPTDHERLERTRHQQTLMYDLPVVTKEEIQARMKADVAGGGRRTQR